MYHFFIAPYQKAQQKLSILYQLKVDWKLFKVSNTDSYNNKETNNFRGSESKYKVILDCII